MRKLTSSTFVTLDGIMQGPGGPGEDDANGFKAGGWAVNYFDEMVGEAMTEVFVPKPDLLLGRKTYQIFAAYWPTAPDEENPGNLNNARKYVVSKTLDKVEWQNSVLVKGDIPAEVAKLKAMDGPELQVHGSSELLQTLIQHRLIDELHVLIFPVTAGHGKRLFGETIDPSAFKLVSSKVSTSGVIMARYTPDGDLKTGTFGE